MNRRNKLWTQSFVHHAVACDAGLACKGVRADDYVKMALAALLKAGMTAMRLAVIPHGKLSRGQSVAQSCLDLFSSGHFFTFNTLPLSRFGLECCLRVEKGRL